MKAIKLYITLALLAGISIAKAQEIKSPVPQYYQQELFINPAVTGAEKYMSGTISIQHQWVVMNNGPKVQLMQLHSPFFKNTMGLGITFQRETYGLTSNYDFNALYAYHIQFEKGQLSFGLNAGVVTSQTRYSEAFTPEIDPNFAYNTKLMWGFDCGFGVYYSTPNYYLGLSMPSFFDNTVDQNTGTKLVNAIDFSKDPVYLTGGVVFDMGQGYNIKLKPSGLLGYSRSYKLIYNAGVTAFFNSTYWAGVNMRYRNEVGGTFGVRFWKNFSFSYSFVVSYGNRYTYRGLSQEVNLNFMLDRKSDAQKRQLAVF